MTPTLALRIALTLLLALAAALLCASGCVRRSHG
jgi:hypothetical protein